MSVSDNDVDLAIDSLNDMDRQLLLGDCSGWGSWMWDSGSYMVSLGLGTKEQGSIQFNTPLAKAVIAKLKQSREERHDSE